jgi:hypothetical protein
MAINLRSLLWLGFLISTGFAFAHHSSTMFDRDKQATLVGEVKEFNWTNPHCSIVIEAEDGKGGKTEWSIEGGSPNQMVALGWKRSIVKPGDKVTVMIRPLRNGDPGGTLMRITLADGQVLRSGYQQ